MGYQMKKKLVVQMISNRKKIDHGHPYLRKTCVWLIEIHYETEASIIEVVEIRPDKKVELIEVMDIIRQQVDTLVPDTSGDCGYRVYRLK